MGHRLIISPGVVLNSVEQDEDDKGYRTTYTFSGSRSECEAQRILERTTGAKQIRLRPKGDGNWELVSAYPFNTEDGNGDGDVPTETHELDTTQAQQDVFTNPKMNRAPADGGLSDANRQTLKDFVERFKRGEFPSVATAITALNSATVNDHVSAIARTKAYFELIALKGVDSWMFYRCVYSKTLTSATPRQVQASFNGVQKLWTTAQLLAWENLPNDWWFQLPIGTVWHKSMPKVTTNIGKSRSTQIQYQYIGSDEASTLLYYTY